MKGEKIPNTDARLKQSAPSVRRWANMVDAPEDVIASKEDAIQLVLDLNALDYDGNSSAGCLNIALGYAAVRDHDVYGPLVKDPCDKDKADQVFTILELMHDEAGHLSSVYESLYERAAEKFQDSVTLGPAEHTPEHAALEAKKGFAYRTLLGELLYAYVTCRPDIGYAIVVMSKFAASPAPLHYDYLRRIAKYLRKTISWGIRYRKPTMDPSLPHAPAYNLVHDDDLPPFPDIPLDELAGFVDAAHANDLRTRRSTTGFGFIYAGAVVAYKSKGQTIVATSSTEAEFIAAVHAAKTARWLRSILLELGLPQTKPTVLYEDNQSTINIVNARHPTERSRHIDIQYFAIQSWKEQGSILLQHLPGIINPADDLTKPLGWVLHARHARRLMGHYN